MYPPNIQKLTYFNTICSNLIQCNENNLYGSLEGLVNQIFTMSTFIENFSRFKSSRIFK